MGLAVLKSRPGPFRAMCGYNDRRKFSKSCCCCWVNALKLAITLFASDPELECAWIACIKSDVRPSCKKKIRLPTPHKGAVRNWLPLAFPWDTLSAKPLPISCTR